jgi:dolichol kinase
MVCLAMATAVALLGLVHPAVAVAGAVAAAAAERWSPPPTDNIWMPLFSALVMAAYHQLLIV